MIEVTYEVYRFRKWRKNSFKTEFPIRDPFILEYWLREEAYKRDLWKIRNLKYKHIKNG